MLVSLCAAAATAALEMNERRKRLLEIWMMGTECRTRRKTQEPHTLESRRWVVATWIHIFISFTTIFHSQKPRIKPELSTHSVVSEDKRTNSQTTFPIKVWALQYFSHSIIKFKSKSLASLHLLLEDLAQRCLFILENISTSLPTPFRTALRLGLLICDGQLIPSCAGCMCSGGGFTVSCVWSGYLGFEIWNCAERAWAARQYGSLVALLSDFPPSTEKSFCLPLD